MSGTRVFGDEAAGRDITDAPGRAQRPEPASDRSRRGRATERPWRRHPPQSGLLVHAAGRDVDRGQPDRHRQRLRRGERLPPRLGIVGVLRDDRFVPRPRWQARPHPGGHGGGNQGSGSHYDGIAIFPTPVLSGRQAPNDHIDGGGDPIAIFDRDGIAYYGQIHFERENDTSGIFVNRSTNGGFTWSRPCIPNAAGVCGGNGDPRQPGDGIVTFIPDNDGILNGSVPFDDKPYGTAGRAPRAWRRSASRRAHARRPCPPGTVGPDRIYITWTRFDDVGRPKIKISYSDDRARSWSPAKVISGRAPFCVGGSAGCGDNQGSQPVVSPTNGTSTSPSRTSTRRTRTSTSSSARPTAARRSRARSSSRPSST